VHQSRRQQVVFGVRGVMGASLTAYGPARALHSGHYGNWAPNPAVALADLVASMRAPDGRILIPGFLDDVKAPTAAEERAIAAVPRVEEALKRELLFGAAEGGDASLLGRIMRPSINLRGIVSGAVGDAAANAIPVEARASIDFRLVPDQTPARIRRLVEAHARARGFHVVHREPTTEERRAHARVLRIEWEEGYPATRTPIDAPSSRALLAVVDETLGAAAVRVPTLGGSLPMHVFGEVLGAPLVVLPIVNHDNDQHAANENLRLQNLWDGIELFAGVLARLRW
jgi:acetylornithine deacetylase/succinyl-diaminopimelate desuccinylase-like protein